LLGHHIIPHHHHNHHSKDSCSIELEKATSQLHNTDCHCDHQHNQSQENHCNLASDWHTEKTFVIACYLQANNFQKNNNPNKVYVRPSYSTPLIPPPHIIGKLGWKAPPLKA
ncbi:hypothetical protein OAA06_01880, partial [bacterium]|nr:hypothetical protein [bacterium]